MPASTLANSTAYEERGLTYDRNGNIKTLIRTNNNGDVLNNLTYTYEGNQLKNLNVGTAYTYDPNGNMTTDGMRGFSVEYNLLNLPKKVSKGTENISYIYSATGNKLAMLKGTTVVNFYAGSCVYRGNKTLDYTLHPEGVVRATGEGLSYEYFLKDHLGNTRVVFSSDGAVLQTTDYYAFGMSHTPKAKENENRYLYNGKEQQDALIGGVKFDWYDYGARFYGPDGSRFFTIDPLAEKFPWQSPYCYAGNNPIRFIDYNGLGPGDRVKAARSMTGIEYKQETVSSMRTANTAEARQYMDCAEFVCRVLGADQITDGVQHMNSSGLKSYFDNKDKFISSADPQVGDIAVWKGHVGVVTEVGEDGKIKLTHARGAGKLSKENPYAISPEQYRDSEFYGYYRPVTETPDGKIDNNGKPVATNNQSNNSTESFDLTPQPETAVQDNTRVFNNSFIQQINNLPQGNYKVVNGQIVPQ